MKDHRKSGRSKIYNDLQMCPPRSPLPPPSSLPARLAIRLLGNLENQLHAISGVSQVATGVPPLTL